MEYIDKINKLMSELLWKEAYSTYVLPTLVIPRMTRYGIAVLKRHYLSFLENMKRYELNNKIDYKKNFELIRRK